MEDETVTRLKRIRGQIDGIIKMYSECRECGDILTQIVAVRAALGSAGRKLLSDKAVECSREREHDKLDKLVKQLFDIT